MIVNFQNCIDHKLCYNVSRLFGYSFGPTLWFYNVQQHFVMCEAAVLYNFSENKSCHSLIAYYYFLFMVF